MNVTAIRVSALLTGMLTGITTQAAAPVLGKVRVCMQPGSGTLFLVSQAEAKAGGMFADIGVKIEWRHGRRECPASQEDTIFITMSTDSLDNFLPGALAYAMPYEGAHIQVFYDRVMKMVEPRRQPGVLAHVLAHEVAHILEGVSRHSDDGVMKANWNEYDFMQMSGTPLRFSPVDVLLIQRGLELRTSRIAKGN